MGDIDLTVYFPNVPGPVPLELSVLHTTVGEVPLTLVLMGIYITPLT